MRVLVAEDQPRVADAVARGLRNHGAAVDVAPDGAQALFHARVHPYDVVLLDRDLPAVHGDDVCRTLRDEQPDLKILMLTAARSTDELVAGLAMGADDYLAKPFRFAELVARVHALSRRAGSARPPVLRRRRPRARPGRPHRHPRRPRPRPLPEGVRRPGGAAAAADGAVVTAEQLLERVWDANVDPFTNTVRMTVMKLRRKLGDPAVVHTVPGAGYRV